MKKLVFLFAAVVLTAISVNVFAQSTGTNPAPGAKQSYSITPGAVGNTLKWTVTKGDLTTTAGTDAVISSDATAVTDITWGTGLTVGDWYYVHIVETGGGCSNEKVLPVQIIASPFYVTLTAANATQCYDNAVVVSLADPSTPNYDHGNATIVFTATPTGLSSSYSGYSFDLGIAYGAYTGLSETLAFSSNASIDVSGKVTVTDNLPVTITYTVDNTTLFTNASAAAAQNYTATATITNAKASNGVSDNGTGDKAKDTAVSRPNTSGITTN